ncbi:MAG: hypothetical protein AAF597_03980 [Bacteroidota bacterium]
MLNFPKQLLFALLFVGTLLFVTSCDEDNLQEQTFMDVTTEEQLPELLEASLLPPPADPDEPNAEPAESRTPCFRFVYPISFVLRNGTTVTTENREDLVAFIARLRNTGLRANFVYPFDLELANGETISILNFREFRRIRTFCTNRDNILDEPCFRYNFPLDVTVNDRMVTINSAWRLRLVLRAAARGATVRLDFPVTVTVPYQDEPLTINSRAELNELRQECGDTDGDRQPCFRFVYPLDLAVGEEIVSVESRAEWREQVQSSGEDVTVRPAYPLDITILATEETFTVNASDGWAEVRDICRE